MKIFILFIIICLFSHESYSQINDSWLYPCGYQLRIYHYSFRELLQVIHSIEKNKVILHLEDIKENYETQMSTGLRFLRDLHIINLPNHSNWTKSQILVSDLLVNYLKSLYDDTTKMKVYLKLAKNSIEKKSKVKIPFYWIDSILCNIQMLLFIKNIPYPTNSQLRIDEKIIPEDWRFINGNEKSLTQDRNFVIMKDSVSLMKSHETLLKILLKNLSFYY